MTTASETPKARTVDMKFEIVVIPVSDIDRAKRFYGDLGWRLDADFAAGDDFRVIQFTPPGSGCSVISKAEQDLNVADVDREPDGRCRTRGQMPQGALLWLQVLRKWSPCAGQRGNLGAHPASRDIAQAPQDAFV
jgi:catechol 2,3-dioxygenase-like lactoylglutathione lyase family enzyme